VVAELVQEKVDVNVPPDLTGPLTEAAKKGHVPMVSLLLEKGDQVDARDSDDKTPLIRAAKHGHLRVVKILVAKGANGKAAHYDGETALMRAAKHG